MAAGSEESIDTLDVPRTSPQELIRCEVNSKCASLLAAARLLPGLSRRDSREMLLLMSEAALSLAQSLAAQPNE